MPCCTTTWYSVAFDVCICRAQSVYLLQEGIRNRTEPAEPNRTKPFDSGTGRNRTRNRTEPNRTEPRRVRKFVLLVVLIRGPVLVGVPPVHNDNDEFKKDL